MRETYKRYPADTSRVLYPVDFDLGYLRREYIYVYAGDNPQEQLAYTWPNDNQIQLAQPPSTPFTIRRVVPSNELINDYAAGAILQEKNLDDSFKQSLMIAMEVDEKVVDTAQNVIACGTAQGIAERASITAADAASSAHDDAAEAQSSKISADTSAVSADESKTQASKWAQNPVGVPVKTGKFSSYHWSEKAREIAQAVALGVQYRGSWDASGGVLPPTPAAGESTDMYIISIGGTLGGEVVAEGDQLVYDRQLHKWNIFQLSNAVKSVNGETGVVTITPEDLNVYTKTEVASEISKAVTPKADKTHVSQVTDGLSQRIDKFIHFDGTVDLPVGATVSAWSKLLPVSVFGRLETHMRRVNNGSYGFICADSSFTDQGTREVLLGTWYCTGFNGVVYAGWRVFNYVRIA